MAIEPNSSFASDEEGIASSSYRCPGCGELVDRRNMSTILEHHSHVRQPVYPPEWFARSHEGVSQRSGPTPIRPATTLPNKSYVVSDEARRRRYGH